MTNTEKTAPFGPVANLITKLILGSVAAAGVYFVSVGYLIADPYTTDVGYRPEQPILYSHALHAGQLGIDCRYCHSTVDQAGFAAVPSVQTCFNCHSPGSENVGVGIRYTGSKKLDPLYEAYESGKPVPWVKVHDLPDYVYFNHAAHVNRGVGCSDCHGRVDHMGEEGVYQFAPLSMSWCLECHREPEKYLRPTYGNHGRENAVVQMDYRDRNTPEQQLVIGKEMKAFYKIRSAQQLTDCSMCHR